MSLLMRLGRMLVVHTLLGRAIVGLGLLLLLLPGMVVATELKPVVLGSTKTLLSLEGYSLHWVDPTGQLSVQEVEARQATLPFAAYSSKQRLGLMNGAALWIRFDALALDNTSFRELELNRAATSRVSLYYRQSDGEWREQHAGSLVPVSEWAYPDRHPVFALSADVDRMVQYWIRVEHERVPFSGEFRLLDHNTLRGIRIDQQLLIGAYFGMVLLLAATASANALVFRDGGFVRYAAYITLLGLAMAASLGVGGQFLWPSAVHWNRMAEFVLLPLSAVAGLLFVRHVVQAQRIDRTLDRLTLSLAALLLASTFWDVVAPSSHSLMAINITASLTLLLIYAMVWAAWRSGERWVRWIAIGILPVLITGTLPILRNLDLLSAGFLSQYGMVIATAIEAPLLIYGLLQRSSTQHEAQARARALEITEPLTGLTNRHNFMLRVHDCLVRSQRYQHHSALLLIHLDNHPHFAEEHGREVADRALVLTGSLLRSIARDVDTAARVADSTLALLMEGPVREAQAVAAATSIVAAGLRPSSQLPVGSTLRFKIVVALLPEAAIDPPEDAQAHLNWLYAALDDLRKDNRKAILMLG